MTFDTFSYDYEMNCDPLRESGPKRQSQDYREAKLKNGLVADGGEPDTSETQGG